MLKNNPASFEFKDIIHNNEKQLALTGLTNDLKNIPSEINYFESIKISNDTIFNAPLKQLQRLTFSKNFITHASFYYNGPPGNLVAAIYIFDKKGTLKKTLYKSSKNHDELYAMKFTDLINEKINYLKSDLQYYKSKKTKIDKNNFWTFATLLPYSTSSIFTGNMSPVSPMANIFYTIHYFLVCCIGIGIFTHFIIKNIRS
ncbi:hypothetical protein [Elizabethkingia ursingii]|uniref:Uncharacterized protein n=1 Tax=Elizabethkingia ursingii TaxID=1756150 RepID=A0ABX3N781_9FLAO|nr:hypothetical protein [Elizabethkingia ursingii]OPB87417.1 hypothetical protein BB021_09065 [Elizabethkingia ursingii]